MTYNVFSGTLNPTHLLTCNTGVLWAHGWMNQDETWHAAPPKKEHNTFPLFCPFLLWPNGSMDQDATWYGLRREILARGHIVLDGDPDPSPERGTAAPRLFSAHIYCGETVAHLSYC